MLQLLRFLIFYPINSICKFFLEVFVFDRQIRSILKGKLAKLYIKKYTDKITKKYLDNVSNGTYETIVWQYWNTGIESAPEIVKRCTDSVRKYTHKYKYVLLDNNNLKDYIEIPDFILEKRQKGIINEANFSDYIRTCLLEKYGGIWIDSTVFLTEDIPAFIMESKLFVFQNDLKIDLSGLNMASYFMVAKPNNELIRKLKSFLELYWRENLFAWNYFFYLHAFTLFTLNDQSVKNMFSKIPFISFIPVQIFQGELLNPYSIERWEQIKKISFAHKLSYKTNVYNKHNLNIEGTFLEKLLNGDLK